MPWFDIVWDYGPGGNVEHLALHGLAPSDVEDVLQEPDRVSFSRSSGRPVAFGHSADGRRICVVFEWIDPITILPITGFEIET
jgi:hypothetical protein